MARFAILPSLVIIQPTNGMARLVYLRPSGFEISIPPLPPVDPPLSSITAPLSITSSGQKSINTCSSTSDAFNLNTIDNVATANNPEPRYDADFRWASRTPGTTLAF